MMDILADNALRILAMLVLLAAVALFGSAETALFSLARHQLKSFRSGANPLLRLAGRLMDDPDGTLVSILLATQTGNVLYFAVAAVLVINTSRHLAGWQSTLVGLCPLIGMIFFGGVLPKVVAVTYPALVAALVAAPLYAFDRLIRPVRSLLLRVLVTPGVRLLSPATPPVGPVGHEELRELLEHSAAQGVLTAGESLLLREVVELGTIKVGEIATPRVDLVTVDITETREFFLDLVRRRGVKQVPAYRDEPDNIVGMLRVRDVLLRPDDSLEDLVRPVWFVPETKRVDSLLRDFQESGREVAIAVDEYGGVTGVVTLQDIVEELIGGEFDRGEPGIEPVRRIDENTYLLSGRLSIREWAQAFGQRFADLGVNTVGGLIAARLGRPGRVGDTVLLRNLRFTVTRTQRHRIVEVRLERLPALPAPEEAAAS
jgi:putative hemolysin